MAVRDYVDPPTPRVTFRMPRLLRACPRQPGNSQLPLQHALGFPQGGISLAPEVFTDTDGVLKSFVRSVEPHLGHFTVSSPLTRCSKRWLHFGHWYS